MTEEQQDDLVMLLKMAHTMNVYLISKINSQPTLWINTVQEAYDKLTGDIYKNHSVEDIRICLAIAHRENKEP